MTQKLRVVTPFSIMEKGDTLVLSNDSEMYSSSYDLEHHSDSNPLSWAEYHSVFNISKKAAEDLIKKGFLEEVTDNTNDKPFVNIFDQIDRLLSEYNNDLNSLQETMHDKPKCCLVEKETVLLNMIKLLTFLKSLKK